MAIIHKKTSISNFENLTKYKRSFEFRFDGTEIAIGDTMILEEWSDEKKQYTGRKAEFTALRQAEDLLKYGYQVVSFEPKQK